jgi:putative ABC transport system permease protein
MFHRQLTAGIVLVNPAARNLIDSRTFPRRRLMQALGVADGEALYIAQVNRVKPGTSDRGNILAFGIRSDFDAFATPGVSGQMPLLSVPGTALFDTGSRGDFRVSAQSIRDGAQPSTEIAGKQVAFEETFRIGASFGAEGSIIVSDQTMFAISPKTNPATPRLA